jgi:DNA-directed RNA polymerase subunit beta
MATKAAPAQTAKKRIRKVFGNIHEVVQMPNLIEVQRESYEQFLRSDPSIGYVSGLEKTLRSVFPIRDFAGTAGGWSSSITSWKTLSTTSRSAASAA